MARRQDFDASVELPPGLTTVAIRKSIEYIEREAADLIDIYLEQMNIFSAVIGILGTKGLDQYSVYEKIKHTGQAQTRFPDLCRRGRHPRQSPRHCLESKGSKRAWAIQSHYDHEGWYVVWRYLVDQMESIEPGKPVIVWRVDVVYLKKEDWKYEKSAAGEAGGGRTHTFGVRHPGKKLKTCAAYRRKDIVVKDGKPIPRNGNGEDELESGGKK